MTRDDAVAALVAERYAMTTPESGPVDGPTARWMRREKILRLYGNGFPAAAIAIELGRPLQQVLDVIGGQGAQP